MEEFLSLVGFLDVDFESQMGPRDFFQVFLGRRGEIPPLLSGISFILRSHRIIKTLGITEGCESFKFQGFAQALLQIHLTGCSVPASPCGKRNPICVGKARAGWGIGDWGFGKSKSSSEEILSAQHRTREISCEGIKNALGDEVNVPCGS